MDGGNAIEYRRANRQYVAMTEDEVWRFLDLARTLYVAFVQPDGRPHVTPVWFVAHDHAIWFRGISNKVKFRLADCGAVSCATADGERYVELRGVMIRGRAEIAKDPAELQAPKEKIEAKYAADRYSPSEVPEDWLRGRRSETQAWVVIWPEKISSWDNAKLR